MISLNNKLALTATLLLAPAVNAASPSSDFALGTAALVGATQLLVQGWDKAPELGQQFADNEIAGKVLIRPAALYFAAKLAQYGHQKLDSATGRSSLLKRLYYLGNGAVAASLFYNGFLKTSDNHNTNPLTERTLSGAYNATSNALMRYSFLTWGPYLLSTAYDSFKKAFATENAA